MKRSIFGRLFETGLLIYHCALAVGWCFCYLAVSVSREIASRVAGVWSES